MDLNPCGGAEHVALSTMEALIEMGIDIELTTARIPDISRLKKVFGAYKINTIFNRVKRINLFDSLPVIVDNDCNKTKDTITINTHGDVLPYYLPNFSSSNAITYCHYPILVDAIRERDPFYLKYLAGLGLVKSDREYSSPHNGDIGIQMFSHPYDGNSPFWQTLQESYMAMLKHSTVITNSSFSKDAILKILPAAHDIKKKTTISTIATAPISSADQIMKNDPLVIPPPVNVEAFRSAALYSVEREDLIVVISRFNPSKKLENAIALARILKKQKIGNGMIIAGGLMPEDRDYYNHIARMIKSGDLFDYVRLEVNATPDILQSILRKGKVYFHPMPGEPFGISIVEAMSAGLIPVVQEIGGPADFVPEKYRFSSLGDATKKVFMAMNASQEERINVSDSVIVFSEANYIKNIRTVIKNLLKKQQGIELDVSPRLPQQQQQH